MTAQHQHNYHDAYRTLGLSDDASPTEIKSAYRGLALECHPDKVVGVDSKRLAHDRFAQISTAYEMLTNKSSQLPVPAPVYYGGPPPYEIPYTLYTQAMQNSINSAETPMIAGYLTYDNPEQNSTMTDTDTAMTEAGTIEMVQSARLDLKREASFDQPKTFDQPIAKRRRLSVVEPSFRVQEPLHEAPRRPQPAFFSQKRPATHLLQMNNPSAAFEPFHHPNKRQRTVYA